MPTIRQSLVASLTRLYPFYSGCGTFANKQFIHNIAGYSDDLAWSSVPGGKVLAPLDDYVGRAAYYVGDLDRKITWICSKIVRPGDTVLDIGANIGMVTVWLSSLVGQKGKVHAFEPNPGLHKMLEKTLEHNGISNVRMHQVALGSQEGRLELRIPHGNRGSASLIRNQNVANCDIAQVPITRLSEIIKKEGIESIRLIKIDVEGFEGEVLKGGGEIFNTIRPEAIVFELNGEIAGEIRDEPVIKILRHFKYKFFSIPRCLLSMHLKHFNPENPKNPIGHDFLAVPEECFDKFAKLVNAIE